MLRGADLRSLDAMSTIDAQADTLPLGGPSLPQERRLVTELPGPRSAEILARKAMQIASEVCVFTNDRVTVETIEA